MPNGDVAIAAFKKQKALITGASGRMAAEMLTRLGFACSVADLYADRDSRLICESRVTKLPKLSDLGDCEQLVREHDFVVFAGGLEGCPTLARKLAQWTKPAFMSGETIEELSDYRVLNRAMTESGIDRYLFSRDPQQIDFSNSISKDLRHSGTAKRTTAEDFGDGFQHPLVAQQFIDGKSVSVIFCASSDGVKSLGGSIQLTDEKNPFSWVGSVSGLQLDPEQLRRATTFAIALTRRARLHGVFGIDFILNEDGIWPVDVNPRIPASAEVVGDHVMQHHLNAFGIDCPVVSEQNKTVRIKRVLFNRMSSPICFYPGSIKNIPIHFLDASLPASIADVPCDGELIEPGHPILSVVASAVDEREARAGVSRIKSTIFAALSCENEP